MKNKQGEDTQQKARKKPGGSFQKSSSNELIQITFNSSSKVRQHMWNAIYQKSSLETQCSKSVLGYGHVGTLRLASTKIPYKQKDHMCST